MGNRYEILKKNKRTVKIWDKCRIEKEYKSCAECAEHKTCKKYKEYLEKESLEKYLKRIKVLEQEVKGKVIAIRLLEETKEEELEKGRGR